MKRILIVEDDEGIRETVADIVESLEYRALESKNGLEALTLLESERPDLIVSDIMMPHMDGNTLLERLKSDQYLCTIPVIMLTAKADIDTKLESYKMGADGYITKPFDLRELSYLIKNLINLKENLLLEAVTPVGNSEPEWRFVQELNQLIQNQKSQISLKNAAEQLQLSPSGLQKKLKRYSNQTFQDYVRIFKLSKAKALLDSGKCNVSEAATASGFSSLPAFSRAFKAQFGLSPRELVN
ncbi:response regulator transcription factor [Marinoscillum sp.]|uniref:response regulator transcription factor n=1 Tax=Marinoscillum sp. TaxID=2024838 RepID=UPI003BA8797E